MHRFYMLLLMVSFSCAAYAQEATIKGQVLDTIETKKLQYSNILLIRKTDSILVKTVRADENGHFELNNLKKGSYTLVISYPKMADYVNDIQLSEKSKIDLGRIRMDLKSNLLKEVQITMAKRAVSMKGDTLVFQADSFKVAEHANVLELLKRLPGVEIDQNGKIKAQGKEVNRVLVDGDEFFGDDPVMATRYLKAKGIEEVQIYDKKSKDAMFTGIDDGVREKTINLKTKDNAKNGYISDFDVKSDLSHYHDDGGLAAVYIKKLKVAAYGNQTNLSLINNANQSFAFFSGVYDNYIKINSNDAGIPGAGSNIYNNVAGSGLPDNLKLGGYAANKWNDNKNAALLNYSYFDNRSTNFQSSKTRELLPDGSVFTSLGNNNNSSRNIGNELKATATLTLDTTSTLNIDFRGKHNRNENNADIFSQNLGNNDALISKNTQSNIGSGSADTFNGNVNYSKKFRKNGRTLAVDFQPESKKGSGTQTELNTTSYYGADGTLIGTDVLNLRKEDTGSQYSVAGKISYTEPLSKRLSLQASYSLKSINSNSYKQTYNNSPVAGAQSQRIDSLSNDFKYNSFTNIGKAILQYRKQKLTASSGLEVTQTNFALHDIDRDKTFDRSYVNFAPATNINLQLDQFSNVSLQYTGASNQPAIDQLQPIREIDNPLYQVVGNPNLKPSFSNNFNLAMNKFSMQGMSINISASYSFTTNAITNTQTIDQFNRKVSSFINVSGNNTARVSAGFSSVIKPINIRYGADVNYSRNNNTTVINAVFNHNRNNQYGAGGRLSYFTKDLSFNYISNLALNNGTSSLGTLNSGTTLTHTHNFSGSVRLPYKVEFITDALLSYRPANAAFDKALNTYQWNASLGIKLLKDESLQLKLSVNDILNQQTGYNRVINGNSTSETTFSYIPRFILVGIRWNMSDNFILADKKSK